MSISETLRLFDNLSSTLGHEIKYILMSWGHRGAAPVFHRVASKQPDEELSNMELADIVGNASEYAIIRRYDNTLDVQTSDHHQIYPAFAA